MSKRKSETLILGLAKTVNVAFLLPPGYLPGFLIFFVFSVSKKLISESFLSPLSSVCVVTETESLSTERCRALKPPTTLGHLSGHPFCSTFLKCSCSETSLFLYDKMLSVGLTPSLMAALVSWQLTAQTEDFTAVSPAGFWRNIFVTRQFSHFVRSPGLQEKNLLCFPWIGSIFCLNCG